MRIIDFTKNLVSLPSELNYAVFDSFTFTILQPDIPALTKSSIHPLLDRTLSSQDIRRDFIRISFLLILSSHQVLSERISTAIQVVIYISGFLVFVLRYYLGFKHVLQFLHRFDFSIL